MRTSVFQGTENESSRLQTTKWNNNPADNIGATSDYALGTHPVLTEA